MFVEVVVVAVICWFVGELVVVVVVVVVALFAAAFVVWLFGPLPIGLIKAFPFDDDDDDDDDVDEEEDDLRCDDLFNSALSERPINKFNRRT